MLQSLLTGSAFGVWVALIGVWVVFLAVRPPFLHAMVRARQVNLLGRAYALEKLVDSGDLDAGSAFYRYHSGLAHTFARAEPRHLPGVLSVVLFMLVSQPKPTADQIEAREEARRRYLEHDDLRLALYADIAEIYRYRSLLVWALIKAAEHGAIGALEAVVRALVWLLQARQPPDRLDHGCRPTPA